MKRFDRRVLALFMLALLLLAALALKTILDLQQLKRAAQLHVRDARHGALYGTLDMSLTRVAGESASYVLTRRESYLEEAEEGLATARAALQKLSQSAHTASLMPSDKQHERFIERYRALLATVERGAHVARDAPPPADAAERNKLLDSIYAYEPAAAALRAEMEPHRDYEYTRNELAISQAATRSTYATLAMLLMFALFAGALLIFARRKEGERGVELSA